MSQELITYIILGSHNRLKNLKTPALDKSEEYIFANFKNKNEIVSKIDYLVTNASGRIIVLLPPSCIPDQRSKKALKKISMIDISTWGWFDVRSKENDIFSHFKKISTNFRSIPRLDQGIFLIKDYIFLLVELVILVQNHLKKYLKGFIQELIRKILFPHL